MSDHEFWNYRVKIETSSGLKNFDLDCLATKFKSTLLYSESDDPGESESVEVGYLVSFRVRTAEAAKENYGLYDVFEGHSAALDDYVDVLIDQNTNDLKEQIREKYFILGDSDFLVMHLCVIHPDHRKQNLGWHLMRRTIDLVGGGCELILCKPYPLRSEHMDFLTIPALWLVDEKALDQQRLQKYWQGMGFHRIGDSEIFGYAPNIRMEEDSFLEEARF